MYIPLFTFRVFILEYYRYQNQDMPKLRQVMAFVHVTMHLYTEPIYRGKSLMATETHTCKEDDTLKHLNCFIFNSVENILQCYLVSFKYTQIEQTHTLRSLVTTVMFGNATKIWE